MAKYTRFINDDQWKLLEPLLPKAKQRRKGGRPAIENRQVLEIILWVLRTGARRQDLPDRYPSCFYLLAAAKSLERTRRLARCLA